MANYDVLHSLADARYLRHFAFASRCAELRGFAAKLQLTVEQTVEISAVIRRSSVFE